MLRAIEAVNRAGVPAVLTVHPWELDPNPPRVRLPARLQFAHYFRLSGFRERLHDILRAASVRLHRRHGRSIGTIVIVIIKAILVISSLAPSLLFSTGPRRRWRRRRPAPRIAVDDEPAGAAARVLDEAGALPSFTVPLAVRVVFQGAAGDPALAARLAAFDKRRAPVWLSLPAPAAQEDVEPWRIALRGLLEKQGSALTILEVAVDRQPARLARFASRSPPPRFGRATRRSALPLAVRP